MITSIYIFLKKNLKKIIHVRIWNILVVIKYNLIKIFFKIINYLFPQKLFFYLEIFFSTLQGKGYGRGTYKDEVSACRSILKKRKINTILDIGSNEGKYTESLLKYYKNANYYLFEPSYLNFKKLNQKFSKYQNIKIINKALSDINGTGTLYADKSGSDLGSLIQRDLDHDKIFFSHGEKVTLNRLDFFFSKINKEDTIDYCKIDVEGLEMNILKGFGELIKKTKLIQFEFGGANIDSRTYFKDFWDFFTTKDFKIYIITPSGPYEIKHYKTVYEYFRTTNYIALNQKI